MRFDRAKQQVRVAGPPIVDFVGDDDLVLRLLQFDDFAEFGGLAGLAPRFREGRLFRITSVDGSNRLTILFSAWVSPAKTRALVWRITCRTRGTMLSSSRRSPSSMTCRRVSAARLTPSPISVAKRFACPTTRPVASSNLRSAHGLGVGHRFIELRQRRRRR